MIEGAALVWGESFDTSNLMRVAVALLHLCIEHQTGIHTLVENGINGSAFALLRQQFASYVGGVWFNRCATEQQVSSFLEGRAPPTLGSILRALEVLPGFDARSMKAT